MCEINKNIAKNLKKLRKAEQLTLEELADMSSVSKSMLGEIEREKTNPTITVLWKIAQALKVPLTALIENEAQECTVVRKSERNIFNQEEGHIISTIFPYYKPNKLEILEISLASKATLSNSGHLKGVEEYIFVLSGKINITVLHDKITLDADDSIRFRADNPHKIENITTEPVKLLNIICYK